jgi:hypothetical protein
MNLAKRLTGKTDAHKAMNEVQKWYQGLNMIVSWSGRADSKPKLSLLIYQMGHRTSACMSASSLLKLAKDCCIDISNSTNFTVFS